MTSAGPTVTSRGRNFEENTGLESPTSSLEVVSQKRFGSLPYLPRPERRSLGPKPDKASFDGPGTKLEEAGRQHEPGYCPWQPPSSKQDGHSLASCSRPPTLQRKQHTHAKPKSQQVHSSKQALLKKHSSSAFYRFW